MDSALHDALIARISEWFSARAGHEFAVTVHTGPNVVQVAEGPLLGMEEHPVSKGVYRVLFTDARRVSVNPDEEKFVSVGFELIDVLADAGRLVLDKGAQRVEILDKQAAAFPTGDQVDWPTAVPVSTPVPAPAPPAPPAPVASPAPVPVAGPKLDMRMTAPIYGNAMGSGFFGPVAVRIEQGWMSVTGMRSGLKGGMIIGGTVLWIFGIIGLLFGLIVAANASGDSDMGFAFCLMGFGLLLMIIGLALYFIGRARFVGAGQTETLQFPLVNAIGSKVHYDTNLGCLLALVATPVVGLIVMLAMGKRIVRMTVPNDRGQRPARQMLVLKVASSADGAALDAVLRG